MKYRLLRIAVAPLVVLVFVFAVAFVLSAGSSRSAFAQGGTGIVRVAKTGADAPGCGSAAAPCATIQYAVNQAAEGDEVRVATGTYTGAQQVSAPGDGIVTTMTQVVMITKSLTLRGGYTTGDWDVSDPAQNVTIIDAEGYGRGISIAGTGTQSVTIEGLTVTGGDYRGLGNAFAGAQCQGTDADCGGGLYALRAAVLIRGCVITGNLASESAYGKGGGIYLRYTLEGTRIEDTVVGNNRSLGTNSEAGGWYAHGDGVTMSNCEFIGNVANDYGGAAELWLVGDGMAIVEGSEFAANEASIGSNGRGGAVELRAGRALVRDSTFISNTAKNGGALYAYTLSGATAVVTLERNVFFRNSASQNGGALVIANNSVATLTNNIIAQNTSPYATAVRVGQGARAAFLHNTIAGFESGTPKDGVWVVNTGSSGAFTNNIIVNYATGIYVSGPLTVTADHTLLFGNNKDFVIDAEAVLVSTNEITGSAPMFVDPDGWDYHLQAGSPAIDAGIDAGVTDDIDGDVRPYGDGYDIGADELVALCRKVYLPLVLR